MDKLPFQRFEILLEVMKLVNNYSDNTCRLFLYNGLTLASFS